MKILYTGPLVAGDTCELRRHALERLGHETIAVTMANDRPLLGVGHRGYEPSYNKYDFSHGFHGTKRAVHSSWFGIFAETGYPGLALFITIFGTSVLACRRTRQMAKRGEVTETLGRYAIGMESSLVAFAVGGAFVSYHYNEMLWHFFGLTIVLERVAVAEAAAAAERVRIENEQRQAAVEPEPVPDFVWA